jgi:hypothetical protein
MALLAAFVLSGCYLKLTGGGWMRSANDVDKATFSVNYDVARAQTEPGECEFDLEAAHIRGTYHDLGTGVRFKINDENITQIRCFGVPGDPLNDCAAFETSYVSLDPNNRGTGTVRVRACDDVELDEQGGEPVDTLRIAVESGPYEGYQNSGPVLGGNFQGRVPGPDLPM